MPFDFDRIIDRKGTNCIKYDFAKEYGLPEDVLPMWVADMDFQTAPPVLERLHQVVDHGIFGYSDVKEAYTRAVTGWFEEHFGWKADPAWIVKTPGVVFALSTCVRAFTQPGDAVLIQPPVYYPFRSVIRKNGRRVVDNPLILREGRYEIDFEDFERKLKEEQVKLFILCSPHNPVSRVWEEEELRRVSDLCLAHGVTLVSDEIHSDFVWEGHRHHPLLSLSEAYQEHVVACTAPSKSFNLAGLQCSNIFIPNPKLREAFCHELDVMGVDEMNIMGLTACQAAYEEGGPWLEEAKAYIWENILYMERFLKEKLPELTMIHPQGTYLIWVDFRSLGLSHQELQNLIEKKAGLWLDHGAMFGAEGEGFQRFNLACPRETVQEAMERLYRAMRG